MGLRLTFALGAALIALGAALVSVPLALIIAGLLVFAFAALFLLDV